MHRINIYDLSPADRRTLAGLIAQYTTPEVINQHWNAVMSGAHNDPAGFLYFHRSFIQGLERYLVRQGYPQWSPLPKWDPAQPVPPEFNIPNSGPDRLRNLNPRVSFSPQFDRANLAGYPNEAAFGTAIIPVHNRVHVRVGGIMNDVRRAPEAPIFWPFHAFVDDIWWEWQRL